MEKEEAQRKLEMKDSETLFLSLGILQTFPDSLIKSAPQHKNSMKITHVGIWITKFGYTKGMMQKL